MQYFCVFVVVREKTDAISQRFVVVIINRQRGMRDQCAFVVHGKEGARPQRIYGDEGRRGVIVSIFVVMKERGWQGHMAFLLRVGKYRC